MHGDTRMFGISFIPIEPSFGTKHRESVMETSSRLRLTKSVDRGPDLEVSNHPHVCKPSLYHRVAWNENADHVLNNRALKRLRACFSKRSVYDHYAKMLTPRL